FISSRFRQLLLSGIGQSPHLDRPCSSRPFHRTTPPEKRWGTPPMQRCTGARARSDTGQHASVWHITVERRHDKGPIVETAVVGNPALPHARTVRPPGTAGPPHLSPVPPFCRPEIAARPVPIRPASVRRTGTSPTKYSGLMNDLEALHNLATTVHSSVPSLRDE